MKILLYFSLVLVESDMAWMDGWEQRGLWGATGLAYIWCWRGVVFRRFKEGGLGWFMGMCLTCLLLTGRYPRG